MRLTRAGLTALIGGVLSACYTVQPIHTGELQSLKSADRVWIMRADQSTISVSSPQLVGDTVIGRVDGIREHFLLSDTVQVGTRHLAPARTAAAVSATVLGVAGFAYLNMLFIQSLDYNPDNSSVCYPPGSGNEAIPFLCPKPS